jgi:putative membrane protein
MIEFLVFILLGVCLGCIAGLIPGLHSSNITLVLMSYGLITSQINLIVLIVGMEVAYAFFQFLSPILFSISDDLAALAIEPSQYFIGKEFVDKAIKNIVTGGLIGVLLSLPLLLFAQKIYPVIYEGIRPLVGQILLIICIYMVWLEGNWKKCLFASSIFVLSGILGLLVRDSGFLPSNYLFLPIFLGLYGFSSIIASRWRTYEIKHEIQRENKIRVSAIAFLSSLFASFIPSMKRSQAAVIALQTGKIRQNEQILFVLSIISLAYITLSILVLSSTGVVRSIAAYNIREILGDLYVGQTLLLIGSLIIAACVSSVLALLLVNPLSKILSKVNKKYLRMFGFCLGLFLIIIFTGWKGLLLAFTSTCIGILSILLKVRSTHLMGVLLLPSIIAML